MFPGMLPGMQMGAGGLPGQPSSASVIAQALANKKVEESLSHEENLTLSNPNQRYALMQKLARGTSAGGKVRRHLGIAHCCSSLLTAFFYLRLLLPRVQSSRCMVLKNMVGPDDVDDELEGEITDEASKYGIVERVVIYQERQSDKPGDVLIKIFILFQSADRT
jgi:hypothetical protein